MLEIVPGRRVGLLKEICFKWIQDNIDIIPQMDFPNSLMEDLINYNKIVSQRNALLKRFAETGRFVKDSLEVWDLQLVEFAKRINAKRRKMVSEITAIFQHYYELISGGKEGWQLLLWAKLI